MRKNNYICNKFKTSNLWDEEEYQMKKNKNDCSKESIDKFGCVLKSISATEKVEELNEQNQALRKSD
mgnify:CR=1 FL=1